MKISHNHGNNNMPNELRGTLSQRQRRDSNNSANENRPVVSALNGLDSEQVSISNEARRRLMIHKSLFGENRFSTRQQQAEAAALFMETDDTETDEYAKLEGFWSGELFIPNQNVNPWNNAHNGVNRVGLLMESRFFENNQAQTDLISYFAAKVNGTINSTAGPSTQSLETVARHQLSVLANSYIEMRQRIEEKFTGEELEEHLRWLSQGFDIMAEDISTRLAEAARLQTERSAEGAELSEQELERLRLKLDRMTPDLQELLLNIANLFRQFALENGAINLDVREMQFEAFAHAEENSDSSSINNELRALDELLGRY
ncbi:MAG: hypothetical protein FWC13_13055 [Oscillospiraceae bacterium]|nr:hypothetical protein [Oscillospiraceae bacterium]